jgi:hypothetical protein
VHMPLTVPCHLDQRRAHPSLPRPCAQQADEGCSGEAGELDMLR